MSPRGTPGLGQEAFPIAKPEVDLNARKAVGGLLKPEDYGIELSDLAGVGPEDLSRVQPDSLKNHLYPEFSGDEKAIANLLFDPRNHRLILVSPEEYLTFPRSPRAFERSVHATTARKNEIDPNIERRQDKIDRSVIHALGGKAQSGEALLRGYKNEKAKLYRALKATRARGWSRMNREQLGMLMNSVLLNFEGILYAIAEGHGWDGDARKSADKALKVSLFTGPQDQKIHNLTEMLKPAITYNQNKLSLLNLRLNQVKKAELSRNLAKSALEAVGVE